MSAFDAVRPKISQERRNALHNFGRQGRKIRRENNKRISKCWENAAIGLAISNYLAVRYIYQGSNFPLYSSDVVIAAAVVPIALGLSLFQGIRAYVGKRTGLRTLKASIVETRSPEMQTYLKARHKHKRLDVIEKLVLG